ncbi:MAG: feruloyl-CoA synthase [Casimicrobiaceae bacterium]|nr:feruloyl-CoA synthase [Casimicrobiaceae bacterium]
MSRSDAIAYRAFTFGVTEVEVTTRGDSTYLRAPQPLATHATSLVDRLEHWARVASERTFLAERERRRDGSRGDWRRLSYADALGKARAIAAALLDRELSAERPIAILSGNSLEHALLALGAMIAGIPFAPISPAYALASRDHARLRHVLDLLTPGLVFVQETGPFARAIAAAVAPGTEVLAVTGSLDDRPVTPFAALLNTPPSARVDAARTALGPDTIVKFLFTSGSTQAPKAVINTARMLCANQQQIAQAMPDLGRTPPVLLDWLPWNHTFGGNHNFGLVLWHGGTLYIDEGRPTREEFPRTLANLREITPTHYFNVPLGWTLLAEALDADAALRKQFFSRLTLCFYAGAALAQPTWDALHRLAEETLGERVVIATGLGMTETAPFALFPPGPDIRSGDVGLPAPGLEVKLTPHEGKLALAYRGPNVTPGYWRMPEATRAAFDEEGFFISGDAVAWIDPSTPRRGLRFDGRTVEDFKLASGTFVSVGPLRLSLLAALAPYAQDVVLTGLNREDVGALVFPTPALSQLAEGAPLAEAIHHPAVRAHFAAALARLAGQATGSASRVTRLAILTEPPSLDAGEITDKGSINQRAVLTRRAALVDALHDGSLPGAIVLGQAASATLEHATKTTGAQR